MPAISSGLITNLISSYIGRSFDMFHKLSCKKNLEPDLVDEIIEFAGRVGKKGSMSQTCRVS